MLTASQVGGVSGRVFWGWMADRMSNAFSALLFLGIIMVASSLLCMALTPDWPMLAACALFFVMGSTASGWNGAFLAEVARLAPREMISIATGGSLVFVNTGKAIGPIAFANVALLTGDYTLTFALLAVPAAAGLWCVWAAHRGLSRGDLREYTTLVGAMRKNENDNRSQHVGCNKRSALHQTQFWRLLRMKTLLALHGVP